MTRGNARTRIDNSMRYLAAWPVNQKIIDYTYWCCQTDSNQSQFAAKCVNLCGTKLPPLSESSGAVQLEVFSGVEVTFLIEMIVH